MEDFKTMSPSYQLNIENLDITVEGTNILTGVNSAAKSGELLAIMGPTGAGKSTLLNAIAGRIPITSGEITLNGEAVNKESRPLFGFVLQEDVFMSRLTLYETLYYLIINYPMIPTAIAGKTDIRVVEHLLEAEIKRNLKAMIRIPETVSWDVKQARIYEIVDSLDLRKCLHTVVGDLAHRGISGGENKRLSIACELLSDPNIMLVDEPTSGLDSNTALCLMIQLHRYATLYNKLVIAAIHQPSSQIYGLFSNLLLLMDGKTVYFGKATMAVTYFEETCLLCAVMPILLIFCLLDLGSISQRTKPVRKVTLMKSDTDARAIILHEVKKRRYFASQMEMTEPNQSIVDMPNVEKNRLRKTESTISLIHVDGRDRPIGVSRNIWPTSFWTQFKMLTWRQFKQSRGRMIHKIDVLTAVCTAFIVGLLYFRIDLSYKTLRDKMGASIGQVIGSGIADLKLSVMTAQLYIACSILLSGFYNHHTASWFKWAKYVSIVHYPYACVNILMTDTMPVLWCNTTSVELFPACKKSTFITRNEVLREFQIDSPYYCYIATMGILLVILTILGYFVLKWQKY